MKTLLLSLPSACAIATGLLLAGVMPAPLRAQDAAAQPASSHRAHKPANALVRAVRAATERYKDVAAAEAEGYTLMFGCVSGPDFGAMGLHYVNLALVTDGVLDPARPEIVIYEPQPERPAEARRRRLPGVRRVSGTRAPPPRRSSWGSC